MSVGRDLIAGGSNASRGIYAGGRTPSNSDVIDYITIATTGNAVDFGNLLAAGYMGNGGSATSSTRMVLSGIIAPGFTDTIQYLIIQTQGDTVDFGNLSEAKDTNSVFSNAHGGL